MATAKRITCRAMCGYNHSHLKCRSRWWVTCHCKWPNHPFPQFAGWMSPSPLLCSWPKSLDLLCLMSLIERNKEHWSRVQYRLNKLSYTKHVATNSVVNILIATQPFESNVFLEGGMPLWKCTNKSRFGFGSPLIAQKRENLTVIYEANINCIQGITETCCWHNSVKTVL